jgi:hypothetical protein
MVCLSAVVLTMLMQVPADEAKVARQDVDVGALETSALAEHVFWDWQNVVLFSGVAAGRALDYFSTRNFRQKKLKEWLLNDEIVDNRPLFVAIEATGTAVSIAASYLLHRTGHHRLERWASILHITFATAGGIWNYTLPNGL